MRLLDLRHLLGRSVAPPPSLVEPPVADPDTLSGAGAWTRQRLRMAEELWGEGFLCPGGGGEVRRLAVPLGLSASAALLLLGAGAGGPALLLAGELGVWVEGRESDPYLAAIAARRVQRAGVALAKRAAVASWDPRHPGFGRNGFDLALTLDVLRTGRPEDILGALTLAVKSGGRIALAETVAPVPLDPADPAAAAWLRLDRREPPLPDPARVTRTLERLGFVIHAAEDISTRHMRQAVSGWRRRLRDLRAEHPDAAHAAVLVAEAELWLRRVRLMRAGRIRMMRWLAERRDRPA